MARKGNRVLLGFADEPISEKFADQMNFTTNKIGGKADWPGDAPTAVSCKLCGLNLPLVLQVYAPREFSPYHRTLYIFACINPNCWQQNGSWICLRSQILDTQNEPSENVCGNEVMSNNEWCSGSDDWDDEENGNLITSMRNLSTQENDGGSNCDMDTADDSNANSPGDGGSMAEGAMCLVPLMATATIEGGDEGDVVCIDSPLAPQANLIAVLEETAPLPQVPISSLHFQPIFISVVEEEFNFPPSPADNEQYQKLAATCLRDEEKNGAGNGAAAAVEEKYEKTLPAHGDKMFYQFISKLQANPGQILRYGGHPLPLFPFSDRPKKCRWCGAELIFELQVLPTLILKLRLANSSETHLEFGSVFLYSCRDSCWHAGDSYREEELIVQAEKL